jgi:hypothetical protein
VKVDLGFGSCMAQRRFEDFISNAKNIDEQPVKLSQSNANANLPNIVRRIESRGRLKCTLIEFDDNVQKALHVLDMKIFVSRASWLYLCMVTKKSKERRYVMATLTRLSKEEC